MPERLTAAQFVEQSVLLASPPETVYGWLKQQVRPYPRDNGELDPAPWTWCYSGAPLATLTALHERHDRLIDLGLAQFCPDPSLLQELYDHGDEAMRCAVLGNELYDIHWLSVDRRDKPDFLEEGSPLLLPAWLSNPRRSPYLLEHLFRREPPFEALTSDRWEAAVVHAANNAAIAKERDDEDPEDSAPWSARAGAWGLLDKLDATEQNARLLSYLFHRIGCAGAPENVTFLQEKLSKWRGAEEPDEEDDNAFGQLRQVVAAGLSLEGGLASYISGHDDLFVRSGFYQHFKPWNVDDVAAAYNRDGRAFLRAAVKNQWFYRRGNEAHRRKLLALIRSPTGEAYGIEERYFEMKWELAAKNPHVFAVDGDDERYAGDEATPTTIGKQVADTVTLLVSAGKPGREVFRLAERLRETVAALERKHQATASQAEQRLNTGLYEVIRAGAVMLVCGIALLILLLRR